MSTPRHKMRLSARTEAVQLVSILGNAPIWLGIVALAFFLFGRYTAPDKAEETILLQLRIENLALAKDAELDELRRVQKQERARLISDARTSRDEVEKKLHQCAVETIVLDEKLAKALHATAQCGQSE